MSLMERIHAFCIVLTSQSLIHLLCWTFSWTLTTSLGSVVSGPRGGGGLQRHFECKRSVRKPTDDTFNIDI